MLVKLGGSHEAVRSEEDSLRRLLLMKPFYRAFAKSITGRFTHPTRTVNILVYKRLRVIASDGSHIAKMGQRKQETASHDIAPDNVTRSIRIYPWASIEQVSSDFLRIEDDYWLTSYIEVNEITWSDPVRFRMGQGRMERENRPYFFRHCANLSHFSDLSSRRLPMIG